MIKTSRHFLLCFSALGLLTACSGGGQHHALHTDKSRVSAALERASIQASGDENLTYLSSVYQRNSRDVQTAASYAKALRQNNYLDKALEVLTPFTKHKKPSSLIMSEYAALQILNGNYAAAEKYAALSVEGEPENYEAVHYLAIAQDLQGKHSSAYEHFNVALDNWTMGKATPVLNNLALNLALQGRVEEAVEMISNAAAIDPHRLDVENNFRVIHGLKNAKRNLAYYEKQEKQHAANQLPPVPPRKPA